MIIESETYGDKNVFVDDEDKEGLFKRAEESPIGQWVKKWIEEHKDNLMQRFKQ